VNVGRGPVLDEFALADALERGDLAGAALDVFVEEPLPRDHPLWHARNCIVTAHVAARSLPADIAGIFRENYERLLSGEPLKFRIDIDRGY
jgi:phosphoglycerate dehydrogenase-like enzyme